MEYEVFRPDPDLLFGFSVLNERNQIVARSHTADDPDRMTSLVTPGRHRVRFPISASLFNEGEYFIRLECVVHNKKNILPDSIYLKFPLFATKKNTRFSHLADLGGVFLGNGWMEEPV